jgi:hypothetical protein
MVDNNILKLIMSSYACQHICIFEQSRKNETKSIKYLHHTHIMRHVRLSFTLFLLSTFYSSLIYEAYFKIFLKYGMLKLHNGHVTGVIRIRLFDYTPM